MGPRPLTTVMLALLLLALHLGQASAYNVTLVVKNSRSDEIFPRVVVVSPGYQRIDYPVVQSNGTRSISLEHDSHLVLFFATGCSRINHQVKCISGDYVNEEPVATTMIDYNNGTLTISVGLGYNVGVKVVFQGLGCDRSSISCVLPQDKCLEPEKLWQEPEERGQPRVLVACKSVSGLEFPPGQDCVMPDSYDRPPSAGASCDFKNGIWQVTIMG
ncbi:hypothetical protein EUGRSUZ_L01516 [Eucalyptus grandis]|uniref:Uncharacterized protein n=1 Tax=Eucalyptus grandis TaxID=71139 RepID=A0A058ZSY2_EUCGR|nr:hypothetical protein EUGRSUZ_L01516 [Eucalyptus grandis]